MLATMALLQIGFLVVRARPYGGAADGLLAVLAAATVLAALAVAMLPAVVAARGLAALLDVAQSRRNAIALLTVASLSLGVASVLTQQVFSWDEKPLFEVARVVAEDSASRLFEGYREHPWLGPMHPPLAPLLYGFMAKVFGSNVIALRFVDLGFGWATVIAAFLVFERLYERRTALLAGLLLLASPLFVRIASAATNDMPLTFFFTLALLLALRLERTSRAADAVALGVALGLGLLVKYTMVLAFPVLLALVWTRRSLARMARHIPLVLGVASTLLLAWLGYAYGLGILDTQQHRLSRLASVSWRLPGWALDGLLTKTPSAIGIYTLPWIALGAIAALRQRTAADRFVLSWIALVFVPLLLTLPDNRYFLPAFPALTALGARALVERPRWALQGLLLAWLLCGITLAFYTHIDLAKKAFLFLGR